jgi:hypothetical protein
LCKSYFLHAIKNPPKRVINQVEYQEGQAKEPVPRVTVNVGDRMPLPDVPVPTTVMVPVTVVEVIPLTACLTVIQSPLFPAGTLIVPKSRVFPLMLRVMEAVVVPDTEAI